MSFPATQFESINSLVLSLICGQLIQPKRKKKISISEARHFLKRSPSNRICVFQVYMSLEKRNKRYKLVNGAVTLFWKKKSFILGKLIVQEIELSLLELYKINSVFLQCLMLDIKLYLVYLKSLTMLIVYMLSALLKILMNNLFL